MGSLFAHEIAINQHSQRSKSTPDRN